MLELDDYALNKIDDPDYKPEYEDKAQLVDGLNNMKIDYIHRKDVTDRATEVVYEGQFLRLKAVQPDGTCLPTFVDIPLTGLSKTEKVYVKTSNLTKIAKVIGCKGEAFIQIPEKGERLPSVLDKTFAIALKATPSKGRTYYNIDWDAKELITDPVGNQPASESTLPEQDANDEQVPW